MEEALRGHSHSRKSLTLPPSVFFGHRSARTSVASRHDLIVFKSSIKCLHVDSLPPVGSAGDELMLCCWRDTRPLGETTCNTLLNSAVGRVCMCVKLKSLRLMSPLRHHDCVHVPLNCCHFGWQELTTVEKSKS